MNDCRKEIYLVIWTRREQVPLEGMFGQIVGIGHHQVAAVETRREHERDGADPLHDCVRLWSDLQRGGNIRGITNE